MIIPFKKPEAEILDLVCQGKTTWEIGKLLDRNTGTVNHILRELRLIHRAPNITALAVIYDRTKRT